MVPRPTPRRERNNDYSAVGTAGRRTGVTLPPGKLDENGLEEITGLFSSPTKSLPVKQNLATGGDDAQNSSGLTPTQTLSARRSLGAPAIPRPRLASPRKSGINGTPRRSNGIDILSPSKATQPIDVEDKENSESPTPIRVKPRRFAPSPDKRIVNGVVHNKTAIGSDERRSAEKPVDPIVTSEIGAGHNEVIRTQIVPDGRRLQLESTNHTPTGVTQDEDAIPNPIGDVEMEEIINDIDDALHDASPVPESSLSPRMANDRVAERIPIPEPTGKPATNRDHGRKRKSQELGEESAAASFTKPAKKPPAAKERGSKVKPTTKTTPIIIKPPLEAAAVQSHKRPAALRLPGLDKDVNTHLSQRQQAELNQIIEKIKERPGKLKSLYVLKRVKPKKSGADDVRAGRAVVKPLAYWSAEQCVSNNINDGAPGLELGARIPLGSIKEITDDTAKNTKGEAAANEDSDSDAASLNEAHEDGHEEAWEKEIGVFRGQAAVWSQTDQTALEDVFEEADLAYHPSTMLTREVKDSGFKYAKLIRLPFFGSGIVDLPPGTVKRPKNSRMMHLCFFVFKGRVTVNIGEGIEEGECERFSIGKGGVFQVPRGDLP